MVIVTSGSAPGGGVGAEAAQVALVDPFVSSAPQGGRPLLRRLLAVPRFRQDYLAHYRTLLAEVLDPALLETEVTRLQGAIAESAAEDPNLLYGTDLFERSLWEDVTLPGGGPNPPGGAGGRPVAGLLLLAQLRAGHLSELSDMQSHDVRLISHERSLEAPGPRDPVDVRIVLAGDDPVAAVELRASASGRHFRLPMTYEAGAWHARIPPERSSVAVRYYARAEHSDGAASFFPEANWTSRWSYTVAGEAMPVQPVEVVLN